MPTLPALPAYADPEGLGKPLSSYSHLARSGDLLFIAGQCGIDEENVTAGPDIASQTRRAYDNVRIALESQGASLRHVVRFATYLTFPELIPGFYAERERYFAQHYGAGPHPPNTLLIVQGLVRPDLLLEIEATARCEPPL